MERCLNVFSQQLLGLAVNSAKDDFRSLLLNYKTTTPEGIERNLDLELHSCMTLNNYASEAAGNDISWFLRDYTTFRALRKFY